MEVRLAETAGFCFGVQRAVDAVERVLSREEKKAADRRQRIYTYGPIVHNETVVEGFRRRGVEILEDADGVSMARASPEAPPPVIVLRAHGAGEEAYQRMRSQGFTLIDATCPFVQRIQRMVRERTERGECCFLAGDPSHPEVIGITGWARGPVTVLENSRAAQDLPDGGGKKAVLFSQTTFNTSKFLEIIAILEKKCYNTEVINTICNATLKRQAEARDLAGRSDAMIVIGGSSSSNTRKLFEICRESCQYTQLIQTVKDLQFERDEAIRNVGITAGASTPKEIIEEVLIYVRNEFRTDA